MTAEPDVLVQFPAPRPRLGACTEARSTLITLSLDAIRQRDCLAQYLRHLPACYRDDLLSSVAGVWLPLHLAKAHYQAVDALGFSTAEATAIGRTVGDRINGTLLGMMVKMAAEAGVTPWFILSNTGKLYERIFRGGGGTSIVRLGPKDALAEVVGVPLVAIPYFRAAMRGMFQAACELVCRRAYVRELPAQSGPWASAMRISWV
jgi:hypothetical protein